VSGGARRAGKQSKGSREESNNQNLTNTTFPPHSFSVIKTIKIPENPGK
jgi:hypothetical protein